VFTGIVEEIGTIQAIRRNARSSVLTIKCSIILADLKLGDSVSVNGVCLTASNCGDNAFSADVMHETLNRSSIGDLKTGSHVNLERAMPANGRFGGHIVTGHIDGTGLIAAIKKDDNAVLYTIKAPEKILKYIVEKGSVAIDGISLTVTNVTADSLGVSIIPHTAKSTVLSEKKAGDTVNLENDIIGKYVEKLMNNTDTKRRQPLNSAGISEEFLAKHGVI
jgi:riboflavin synthase